MRLWQLRPRIVARLGRWGVDRSTADDLATETLLVGWQKLGTVPTDTVEAERWLGTVARNLLRNHRWRTERGTHLLRLLSSGRPMAEGAPSHDRLVGRTAWRQLSPDDREVLWLVGVHGLGPRDLGARLRCSPAAAKKRLSRARCRLSQLLVG